MLTFLIGLLVGCVASLGPTWLYRRLRSLPYPQHPDREQCPACGCPRSKLRAVSGAVSRELARTFLQHTCDNCGARWHCETLLKDDKAAIQPAA
jgi:hypothetical protein